MAILESIFLRKETEESAEGLAFVEAAKAPLLAEAARMPKEMKKIEAAWGDFTQYVQREVYSVSWRDGLPRNIESSITEAQALHANVAEARAALEELHAVTCSQLRGCRFDNQPDPNVPPMWRASVAARFRSLDGAAVRIRQLQAVVQEEIAAVAKQAGANLDQTCVIAPMPAPKARQPVVESHYKGLK